MTKSKYRLEVLYWDRSPDGDDWVLGSYWVNFDNLQEAIEKTKEHKKNLIKSELYSMIDSKDLIYSKDWESGEVKDYTTVPDLDYHNREYD